MKRRNAFFFFLNFDTQLVLNKKALNSQVYPSSGNTVSSAMKFEEGKGKGYFSFLKELFPPGTPMLGRFGSGQTLDINKKCLFISFCLLLLPLMLSS